MHQQIIMEFAQFVNENHSHLRSLERMDACSYVVSVPKRGTLIGSRRADPPGKASAMLGRRAEVVEGGTWLRPRAGEERSVQGKRGFDALELLLVLGIGLNSEADGYDRSIGRCCQVTAFRLGNQEVRQCCLSSHLHLSQAFLRMRECLESLSHEGRNAERFVMPLPFLEQLPFYAARHVPPLHHRANLSHRLQTRPRSPPGAGSTPMPMLLCHPRYWWESRGALLASGAFSSMHESR
jgi:hypothetical protein